LKPTRIAVIGDGLALEIVGELASKERDLQIVKRVALPEGPLQARTLSSAHVVVTSLDGATPASVSDLLAARPQLRVLAISADGGESFLYELRPHKRLLGEISKETLLAAIRGDLPNDAGSAFEMTSRKSEP
jgi:hypothetical protein